MAEISKEDLLRRLKPHTSKIVLLQSSVRRFLVRKKLRAAHQEYVKIFN